MTILDQIIQNKLKEVALAKKRLPLSLLKQKLLKTDFPRRHFRTNRRLQLIAEVKAKSPSAGIIRTKIDVNKLAKQFQNRGASAISVLTDHKYFGGSLKNLQQAKAAVKLPVLRKEFVIDKYQLFESRLYGADMVLLITAVLKSRIGEFVKLALRLNLQPIIEVHTESELKNVLKLVQPSEQIVIGINNRDLKTFNVPLDTSLRLIKLIPKKFIRISESGVFEVNQLRQLSSAGFDGVLIGTGLAKNPELFEYFVGAGFSRPSSQTGGQARPLQP